MKNNEYINCPFCNGSDNNVWAEENGFTAVRCVNCHIIYVNPRPVQALISEAVKTGVHSNVSEGSNGKVAIARRLDSKVELYKALIASIFPDVWGKKDPISWLDIGAGYGEIIEAITLLAPPKSTIEGLEPMEPKANDAKKRGLKVREIYLNEVNEKYDYVSIINIFSHIPNFRDFLVEVKSVLNDNGELLLETGNTADVASSQDISAELNLPDHLVFAGEKHIEGFLKEAGFTVLSVKKIRKDNFIIFCKNVVKKIRGRKVNLIIPYTSKYRTMLIRAKI